MKFLRVHPPVESELAKLSDHSGLFSQQLLEGDGGGGSRRQEGS